MLDSDCVIARPDALRGALAAAIEERAALVGEEQWDPWHQRRRFGVHCLLVDPTRVWRDPISPFADDGDPLFELLRSCEADAVPAVTFPFLANGHVIHRGRGTLAQIAARDDRSNRFHEWAKDHHDAHFAEVPGAAERYAALLSDFGASVPSLTASELVHACRRYERPV